jgi:hypothetical protein
MYLNKKEGYAVFNNVEVASIVPEEDREKVDMESFVSGVEEGLVEYVNGIKKSLGLPEDAPVEIKEEDGEVEVKADADGDGEMETVATEETEVTTESDGTEEETVEDEEVEDDEPSDEEMEKYLNGED